MEQGEVALWCGGDSKAASQCGWVGEGGASKHSNLQDRNMIPRQHTMRLQIVEQRWHVVIVLILTLSFPQSPPLCS